MQLENESGVILCFITEHTTARHVLTVFEHGVCHAMFYPLINHCFEQQERNDVMFNNCNSLKCFILLTIFKFLRTNCAKFHIQIGRR